MFKRKPTPRLRQSTPSRTSKPTFSYYANRAAHDEPIRKRLQPDAAKRLEGPPWWHHLPSIIAGIAIIISLVYTLGLGTNPTVIQPQDSSASLLRTKAVYQQAAQKLLKQSILNHNKITINTGGITRDLETEFPELSNVSVTLPLIGHQPVIYIEPSPPALILTSQGQSYIVDEKGKAVIKTTDSNQLNKLQIPTVNDLSNLPVTIGKNVLPASDVSFIMTVVSQLRAKNVTVKDMSLPPSSAELDVTFTDKVYILKMNLQDDARQQTGAFLAVQQQLQKTGKLPTAYIDVRVSERAYYK